MPKESLLEKYVSRYEPCENVLSRFSNSLANASENTKTAYNTDIWKFLIDKMFRFWDFDIKYEPIAKQLIFLEYLDGLDRKLLSGELTAEDVPKNVLRKIEGQSLTPIGSKLLSKNVLNSPYVVCEDNRMKMQLRPIFFQIKGVLARVSLGYENKIVLL
jgi:hypothetical protein